MEDFKNYMEDFMALEKNSKKAVIYNQLEMVDSLVHELCVNAGIENLKLSDTISEKELNMDYLDTVVVLVNSIQNSIADYNYKMAEILEKIQQKNTI